MCSPIFPVRQYEWVIIIVAHQGESIDRTLLVRANTDEIIERSSRTRDEAYAISDKYRAGQEARDKDALQRAEEATRRAASTDKLLARVARLVSHNQRVRDDSDDSYPRVYQ